MKLEVTRENLAKALSTVGRIVGIKSTLPVLNNVLLKTEKGRLQLSATDLELGLTTWIGAKISEEGAFTVPAKLLTDFVSQTTGETVSLVQKEATLDVKAGESKAQIKGISAEEFPLIPELKGESLLAVAPLILKENLQKTAVAASIDETRPALSGVLFWRQKDKIRLAATDSYRLSEVILDLKEKAVKELKVIVPLRTAQELIRVLEGTDETVAVAVSDNQAVFRTPSLMLVSRLIEGEFPNYVEIIPQTGPTTVKLATDEFLRSIKVASLFAREIANHITLNVDKKGLTVNAASAQVGENKTELAAEVNGEPVSVAFNARFLVDAAGIIKSKNIEATFTGKTSPAVFREEGNSQFLHLVMPLRVEG